MSHHLPSLAALIKARLQPSKGNSSCELTHFLRHGVCFAPLPPALPRMVPEKRSAARSTSRMNAVQPKFRLSWMLDQIALNK